MDIWFQNIIIFTFEKNLTRFGDNRFQMSGLMAVIGVESQSGSKQALTSSKLSVGSRTSNDRINACFSPRKSITDDPLSVPIVQRPDAIKSSHLLPKIVFVLSFEMSHES